MGRLLLCDCGPSRGGNRATTTSPHDRRRGTRPFYLNGRTDTPYCLARDGIDDNAQRDLFCAQAGACPGDTDLNDNGIPDRLEPGAFEYLALRAVKGAQGTIFDPFFRDKYEAAPNRYYRPGQPGVQCEEIDDSKLSDDSEDTDAIACKPIPGLLEDLQRFQAANDPQPGQGLGKEDILAAAAGSVADLAYELIGRPKLVACSPDDGAFPAPSCTLFGKRVSLSDDNPVEQVAAVTPLKGCKIPLVNKLCSKAGEAAGSILPRLPRLFGRGATKGVVPRFIGPVRQSSNDIGYGHAFSKHVVKKGEFPEAQTPDDLARIVERVRTNGRYRPLE